MNRFWNAWTRRIVAAFVSLSSVQTAGVGQDAVQTFVVAPGVKHTLFVEPGPLRIHVLEVDLTISRHQVESYRPVGLVPVSQQARQNDRLGHRVIAAVNCDFFSFASGWPLGNQVVNGEFAHGTQSLRSHLAFDTGGRPFIERLSFTGWFRTPAGTIYSITGVNERHKHDAIVLHTSFSDTATPISGPGGRLLLRLASPRWSVGDTLRFVVGSWNPQIVTAIRPDEAVLWIGRRTSIWRAREDVKVADTLLVCLGFRTDLAGIFNVVGGAGRILLNGKPVSDSVNVTEKTSVAFLETRHPRTFVAFDRDTTKLFLCTVDGRQETSDGMNFAQMADFLLSQGVWNAVNLDGGGSTTMVINGKVVNSPSDRSGERPVANSLQIISKEQPAPDK
jgi:hypothetical protein